MPAEPLGPVPGLGYADLISSHPLVRIGEASAKDEIAPIAEEIPVALVYNGDPFVVVMASPADLEDLGVGFSVTEGIVGSAAEIGGLEVVRHSRGIELQMHVGADVVARLAERRRGISARTGCGVCGIESIDEVLRPPQAVPSTTTFDPAALWRASAELESRQPVNAETRAVHAAAFADREGTLVVVREDVGRHNALDKVLGSLIRDRRDAGDGFVIVTSRASYELVQKTAAIGIPLLAAVSRPTSLAIQLAEQANITLVGLLRGRTANVYSHPARLGLNSSLR
jgi:formate dehydrogenase accessory protein FdhD